MNKSNHLLLPMLGLLLVLGVAPPDLTAVFSRINAEVQQRGQAYQTLREATERIGHRLTGSPNGAKAEAYAYNLFKRYGFTDVKYQPFEVEAWSRDTVTLSVAPRSSDNIHDFEVVSLAHAPVKANLQGEIVDLGNGLEVNFEALKDQVRGKIVLDDIGISPPDSSLKNLHRSEKTALAIRYGAKGMIMVNQVKGNVLLTGTASVTGKLIAIPAVCISLESGEAIRKWIKEENRLEAHIQMRNFSRKIKARNVIATLKGTSPTGETILIGGHLDSWDLATGAIDNGIGSFSIMEIARVFRQLKLKPKRTIQFVLFMGEEQGLLGSKALIRQMAKEKSLSRLRYMINLDMTNNPNGFNACGRDEMLTFFNAIGEQIKTVDSTYANTNTSRLRLHSDHQGFALEGIPVTMPQGSLSSAVLNCYHADCDHFDLVDQVQLNNTVRYTAMMLYALANADKIPATKLDSPATRNFLVGQGLQKELEIGGEWRWK